MSTRNNQKRNGRGAEAKRNGRPAVNRTGTGGETHQSAASAAQSLTTNQGVPIADNQNSLRIDQRGPTLLEDFILCEKITHFDHERIPERIVHARGSGAHGYFQVYKSQARLTKAAFLQDPKKQTPVFVRFSTVAGGAGSVDLPRDVRGFAVKFYTEEGNFDLVGNNIPVFFIQDALKFPDLIHSVKMEPDRGFPQNASAHDTFWDFVSLMPESMHMLMWAMSDRAIPRSLRMIEGFGVNTFRFVNAQGRSTFVKFHWRPVLGAASVLWDEAVKRSQRRRPGLSSPRSVERDRSGDFPGSSSPCRRSTRSASTSCRSTSRRDKVDSRRARAAGSHRQAGPQPQSRQLLRRDGAGRVLSGQHRARRRVQQRSAAAGPPVLASIRGSSRLGGPNFHELEINRPKCPAAQSATRDGHAHDGAEGTCCPDEPASLDPTGPREDAQRGFTSLAAEESGPRQRIRAESFADHYSQARLFWRSMTEPEQRHIVNAFTFELGKVETVAIRRRMLGHLSIIDDQLGARVADKLGMAGQAERITPARAPIDMDPSPALSMVGKARPTLAGRKVGILVADGTDRTLLDRLREGIEKEGGRVEVVAPKIAGTKGGDGKPIDADHVLGGGPSIFFDAVVVAVTGDGAQRLAEHPNAVDWVRDAFGHLKVIGHVPGAAPLIGRAGVAVDEGVIAIGGPKDVTAFVTAAKGPRIWKRERTVEERVERTPLRTRQQESLHGPN
jgi:catalase